MAGLGTADFINTPSAEDMLLSFAAVLHQTPAYVKALQDAWLAANS